MKSHHRASPTSTAQVHLVHWSSKPPSYFQHQAQAERAQRRAEAKAAAVRAVKGVGDELKRSLRELKAKKNNG